MTQYQYIGKSVPRTYETDKVTGRAIYIDDLKLPGMLYGKILYSSYAHARIKRIDTTRAKNLPGVRAVLTGYDIPDVRVGFIKDQTVLKKDVVRQFRDEVAAVAATTETRTCFANSSAKSATKPPAASLPDRESESDVVTSAICIDYDLVHTGSGRCASP